jgi:hypothetical protein
MYIQCLFIYFCTHNMFNYSTKVQLYILNLDYASFYLRGIVDIPLDLSELCIHLWY